MGLTSVSASSRGAKALAIGLATFLFLGAGTAIALGDDETSIQVPAPMGGDQARYEVRPFQEWQQYAYIETTPVEPLVLDDGRWVSSYSLRAGADAAYVKVGDFEQRSVAWEQAHVAADSGRVVATSYASSAGGSASSSFLPLLGGESSSQTHVGWRRDFGPGDVPCGTRSELQGATSIGKTAWVDGCDLEGRRLQFDVGEPTKRAGRIALPLHSEAAGVLLWFESGLPFPVAFEYDESHYRGASSWEMVGFKRGVAELVPGPVPAAVNPPPVEFAPASRLGPDATGFDQPFTLADAVATARESSQDVAAFMQEHPEWFVRSAEYKEEVRDSETNPSWLVELRGDDEALHFTAAPATSSPVPPAAAVFLEQVVPGTSSVSTYTFESDAEPAWPDECRTQAVPTIASLAARWSALQASPRAANAYSFRLGCFGMDGVVMPYSSTQAGDQRMIWPSSGESTQVLDMLEVDGDGDFSMALDETKYATSSWGALEAPAPSKSQAPSIERAGMGAWLPPGEAAAGVGVVSLLAGAAYFLWPLLKGAGWAGLFSRTVTPELLDHPVRRELMQRIEAQPGQHYKDLVRAVGRGNGAVEHHLRKLEAGGLVRAVPHGGYTCYFPAAYDRRLVGAAPALKADGARRLMAEVQRQPGQGLVAAAKAAGMSPATASHHARRLEEAGVLRVERQGRSLALSPRLPIEQTGPTATSAA